MVHFLQNDSSKFTIMESVFRFGADVRSGDNPLDAQLRLIRDGEAISLESKLSLDIDEDEDQNHEAAGAEDEQL